MRSVTMLALVALVAVALPASAFVRVEKTDGRWSFVESDGTPFVQRGVGWVSRFGPANVRTKVRPYRETVKAKYAGDEAWCKATVERLKDWGFNGLGSDSDRILRHRGLRHTILLRMGAAPATWKRDPDDYVMPHCGGPCSAFPNVFSPKFPACCGRGRLERALRERDVFRRAGAGGFPAGADRGSVRERRRIHQMRNRT